MIHVEKPIPEIIHVKADSQYELTASFMRPQEFYESPFEEIRGNFFTVEEYMDLYAKEFGNFTYCTDWGGFNIPGNKILEFRDIFGHCLLNKEARLLSNILDHQSTDQFYVIGTHGNEGDLIDHELAHAFWYLFPEYQERMTNAINTMPTHIRAAIAVGLGDLGYNESVLADEIQAYLATSTLNYLADRLGLDPTNAQTKVWCNMFEMAFNIFKTRKLSGEPTN